LLLSLDEKARDLLDPPAPEDVAVQPQDRVSRPPASVDLGQVPESAAGPYELLALLQRPDPRALQGGTGVLAQALDLAPGRGIGLEVGVGEAERAQGQADRGHEPAPTEVGDLHAAAPHVEED